MSNPPVMRDRLPIDEDDELPRPPMARLPKPVNNVFENRPASAVPSMAQAQRLHVHRDEDDDEDEYERRSVNRMLNNRVLNPNNIAPNRPPAPPHPANNPANVHPEQHMPPPPNGKAPAASAQPKMAAPKLNSRPLFRGVHLPHVLTAPETQHIYIEDGSGFISRQVLQQYLPRLLVVGTILCFSNSVLSTAVAMNRVKDFLVDRYFQVDQTPVLTILWIVIAFALAFLIAWIQVQTSDQTTPEQVVTYWTSTFFDGWLTWLLWIGPTVAVLTWIAESSSMQPIYTIAGIELAFLLGWPISVAWSKAIGRMSVLVMKIVVFFCFIAGQILIRLLLPSFGDETAQIYLTAFGISSFVALFSARFPERTAFGNRLVRSAGEKILRKA